MLVVMIEDDDDDDQKVDKTQLENLLYFVPF